MIVMALVGALLIFVAFWLFTEGREHSTPQNMPVLGPSVSPEQGVTRDDAIQVAGSVTASAAHSNLRLDHVEQGSSGWTGVYRTADTGAKVCIDFAGEGADAQFGSAYRCR
jgi:hypothetical protein